MLNLLTPANRGILAYLGDPDRLQRSVSKAKHLPSCAPKDVPSAHMTLGTHPDLVERLWDELGGSLPVDCRWVVFGAPSLVHPTTGVVFAFAGGTGTYAFRLPEHVRALPLAAGAPRSHQYPAYPDLGIQASVLDLAVIGEEWVFGGWNSDELEWCAAAFAFAGEACRREVPERDG